MSDYRLTATDTVIRANDGASIPNDPDNRDRAIYAAWVAAGGVPDPYVAPPPPPARILSQDLMAQFTADDAAKIQAVVASSPQLWLLWSALQAQSEPMATTSRRFVAGWSALVMALGQVRMNQIAASLGINSSVA